MGRISNPEIVLTEQMRGLIALGFKIDNEKAIAFRKWANQIVSEYTIKGWA